jgi:catalase (peroxidase I)
MAEILAHSANAVTNFFISISLIGGFRVQGSGFGNRFANLFAASSDLLQLEFFVFLIHRYITTVALYRSTLILKKCFRLLKDAALVEVPWLAVSFLNPEP